MRDLFSETPSPRDVRCLLMVGSKVEECQSMLSHASSKMCTLCSNRLLTVLYYHTRSVFRNPNRATPRAIQNVVVFKVHHMCYRYLLVEAMHPPKNEPWFSTCTKTNVTNITDEQSKWLYSVCIIENQEKNVRGIRLENILGGIIRGFVEKMEVDWYDSHRFIAQNFSCYCGCDRVCGNSIHIFFSRANTNDGTTAVIRVDSAFVCRSAELLRLCQKGLKERALFSTNKVVEHR